MIHLGWWINCQSNSGSEKQQTPKRVLVFFEAEWYSLFVVCCLFNLHCYWIYLLIGSCSGRRFITDVFERCLCLCKWFSNHGNAHVCTSAGECGDFPWSIWRSKAVKTAECCACILLHVLQQFIKSIKKCVTQRIHCEIFAICFSSCFYLFDINSAV